MLHEQMKPREPLSHAPPPSQHDQGSAPSVLKASLNSLTAVAASSKFNALMANLACFCANATALSSVIYTGSALAVDLALGCTGARGGLDGVTLGIVWLIGVVKGGSNVAGAGADI